MRRPLVIVLAVVAILIAGAVVGGILISQAVARQNALTAHRAADAHLREVLADAALAAGEGDEVLALAGDPLLPADPLAAVVAQREVVSAAETDAGDALAIDVEPLGTEEVHDLANDLRTLATALAADDDELSDALDALVDALAANAPTVEAAGFDANNAPHIAYRLAAADLDVAVDDRIGEAVGTYLDAAHALEASHAAELAEKAGPLFDARMAVQAFARSLSGGVLLEFDWAPTVNGYGFGGTYGGTSYWKTADGGQATVTLSDSVASMWPGAGVQALVVHEVGHAILARHDCNVLFFESDLYPGEEESWATAWAIGMGYTADGSGESVYGRPPDALIALSQQCR